MRSYKLQQCRWTSLILWTKVRSNSWSLRVQYFQHCLADGAQTHFLSGRCIRAKITFPPLRERSILQGSEVFDSAGARINGRLTGPRLLVRCFRWATVHVCARSDRTLSARVTGPFSRSIGSHVTIFAASFSYATSFNRCCTIHGLQLLQCGA